MSTYLGYEVEDHSNEYHPKRLWFREWEDVVSYLMHRSDGRNKIIITSVFVSVETVEERNKREAAIKAANS